MKIRPILMSTPMVQAVLSNSKTKTRRTRGLERINEKATEVVESDSWPKQGDWVARYRYEGENIVREVTDIIKCPYGKVGDILWVRETWQYVDIPDDYTGYIYKASGVGQEWEMSNDEWVWKPSIHMPKKACRLFLEITAITVEKLHDITERGVIEEGIQSPRQMLLFGLDTFGRNKAFRSIFQQLWEKLNGSDSWYSNPWVWVISFKRTEKPENFG